MNDKSLSQPSAPAVEFYGTCPPDAELPPELPAGTRNADRLWTAKSTVRLGSDGFYSGHWERDDGSASETDGGFSHRGIDWTTVRRLPAPSADKWEPKVGDFVRGRTTAGSYHGADVEVQGWYREPMAGNPSATMIDFKEDGTGEIACVSTASLVLIRPATPSPKAEEVASPAPKTDPYQPDLMTDTLPNGKSRKSFAAWNAEQNAKHAALVAKHKADLDRGKAERLRNTRNWPEAWSTAGWED